MSKPVREGNSKEEMDKLLLEIFKDMKGKVMRSLAEMPVEDRDQYARIMKNKWKEIQEEYINLTDPCYADECHVEAKRKRVADGLKQENSETKLSSPLPENHPVETASNNNKNDDTKVESSSEENKSAHDTPPGQKEPSKRLDPQQKEEIKRFLTELLHDKNIKNLTRLEEECIIGLTYGFFKFVNELRTKLTNGSLPQRASEETDSVCPIHSAKKVFLVRKNEKGQPYYVVLDPWVAATVEVYSTPLTPKRHTED